MFAWFRLFLGALLVAETFAFVPSSVRINSLLVPSSPSLSSSVTFVSVTDLKFDWQISNVDNHDAVSQTHYSLALERTSPRAAAAADSESWTTGLINSSNMKSIQYTGPPLHHDTRYRWKIEVCINKNNACSEPATGLIHTEIIDWQNASFIGHASIQMNQLRRPFSLSSSSSSLSHASLYIATLGLSEVSIDGVSVDATRKLDPVWSTYERRMYYSAFDVTALLTSSSSSSLNHCIGVMLGNGWFSQEQYLPPSSSEPLYGLTGPSFMLLLSIVYNDGTQQHVVTDDDHNDDGAGAGAGAAGGGGWRGRQGPITHDSLYNGEAYDARLVRAGWDTYDFTDATSLWLPASVVPLPFRFNNNNNNDYNDDDNSSTTLTLLNMEPIRAGSSEADIIKPIAVMNPALNVLIFDMGQNFAGWCRVKLRGPRGLQVTFRYAEVLEHPQQNSIYGGFVYTDNLRGATATDTFILSGSSSSIDVYEPRFTVHGFRYLQVMGAFSSVTVDDVVGVVVHSALMKTSTLTFENALLNQIQRAVVWGLQSNMMGIMSDCPQRDERKGWMGDAGLTVDTALYNFDAGSFYATFLQQISDVQKQEDGQVPDTVPFTFGSYPADPNWGLAYPEIVYRHYSHYGDSSLVSAHYAGVRSWVEYLRSRYKIDGGLKNMYYEFGDWVPPSPNTQTDPHLISSFAFLTSVSILSSLAVVVNNTEDVTTYRTLYSDLCGEFHSAFYSESIGGYADGKQTANILALKLDGVVPAAIRQTVVNSLVDDIRKNGNHHTSGIIGIRHLFSVLSASNASSVALDLLLQTSYPSYGYMFNNPYENATTMWEVFDAPFQGAGMNSRNHHMFASVGSFLQLLAGISVDHFRPLKHVSDSDSDSDSDSIITISPLWSDSRLSSASNVLKTIYGSISVSWSVHDDVAASVFAQLNVTVPMNTDATVILSPPSSSSKLINAIDVNSPSSVSTCSRVWIEIVNGPDHEDGRDVEGVLIFDDQRMDGSVLIKFASGSYAIKSTWRLEQNELSN